MKKQPLQALQSFVVVAREGKLATAASRMNLTVSALSHQMNALEEELGKSLLLRGPRGVSLTPDGERLLAQIRPHFDGIGQALSSFSAIHDQRLSVSVMPSLASGWLMPRLPSFTAEHPQIEISISSSASLVDFARSDFDVALRFGLGQWAGLDAIHLFDEWITPVASPSLLKQRGKPSMQALGDWPLLGDPSNRWQEWFAHFGGVAPRKFVASFADTETLHRAAAEGLGIALARLTMANQLIARGLLVPLWRKQLKADYAHYLVYPARSAQRPAVVVFRTWLVEQAAKLQLPAKLR
jgi:LysR family transcriptional regulator, glycine cleavage system transcriptional activator